MEEGHAWWNSWRSANPNPICRKGGCGEPATAGEWCEEHGDRVESDRLRLGLPQLCFTSKGKDPFAPRPFLLADFLEAMACENAQDFADTISVNVRSAHRWMAKPALTLFEADLLCGRAGVHPSEVWPEWWEPTEDDLAEADVA